MQPHSEKTVAADRILFSRILVATDFSAMSQRALQHAVSLAHRFASKLYLVHVITENSSETLDRHFADSQRPAQKKMEELTRALPAGTDFTVLIEKAEGPLSLWIPIERLIHKHQINIIVAGTRGLSARPEPFFGSGAEQLFRHATCPVLTIGPATKAGTPSELTAKNVLYATDFGPSAERALGHAVCMAREFAAKLTFLHVVQDMAGSGTQVHDHLRQINTQRMNHSLSASHENGIQADFSVRFGNVADEILNAAHELPADLIVMGAKALASWAGRVPLSTAYNVAAKASCPVLTVRA